MSEDNFPKILYHYTSAQGFLGILQSRTLWASHILFQNDLREGKIAFSVFDELLNNEKVTKDRSLFDNDILELIREAVKSGVYTLSFSSDGDDLNMWRGYANEPFGLCIGFDRDCLLENLKRFNSISENKEDCVSQINIELKKCIYDENTQKKIISNFWNDCNNKNDISMLFRKMQEHSIYFKHPAFAAEKEIRINIQNTCDAQSLERHKIRLSKNMYIPYFEVFYADTDRKQLIDCIKSITIGPCKNPQFVKKSLIPTCDTYGINLCKTEILLSKIPYIG